MINKILSYYEDALKIKSGFFPVPRMAVIYPTYVCNFKCPHCMYGEMKFSKQNYPLEKLKVLIDELSWLGVKAVVACGGGEPTMYPYFKEMVEHIASRKLEFGLITNGSMLSRYYKVLVDNSRFVRVTIDSINPDNYKKIHCPPKGYTLGKTLGGIERLLDYRKTAPNKCTVGVKTLLSKKNFTEKYEIELFFKSVGVDYVSFKPARGCAEELKEIPRSTLKCHCFMTPIQTMIDPYGDVYVCSFYQYRLKSHTFGNVLNRPFKEVWYSKEHREAIDNLKISECNKYECKLSEYSNEMDEILTKDPDHINFF